MKEARWATSPRPSALHGADGQARGVHRKKDQTLEFSATAPTSSPRRCCSSARQVEALTEADVRVFAARAARFANAPRRPRWPSSCGRGRRRADRGRGRRLGAYRFTKYLTGDRVPKNQIERVSLIVGGKVARRQGRDGPRQQVGEAVWHRPRPHQRAAQRALPAAFADRAVAMCKERGLEVKVMDKAAIQKKGMKLFIAVARAAPSIRASST